MSGRPHSASRAAREKERFALSLAGLSGAHDERLYPEWETQRWRPTKEQLREAAGFPAPEGHESWEARKRRLQPTTELQKLVRSQINQDVPGTHRQMFTTTEGKRARTISLNTLREDSLAADITGSPSSLGEVEERNVAIFEPAADPEPQDIFEGGSIFEARPGRAEMLPRLMNGESLRKLERISGVPKSTLSRWKRDHMETLADLTIRVSRLEDEQERIAQRTDEISRANPEGDSFVREMGAYLLGVADAEKKVSHFCREQALGAPIGRDQWMPRT